MNKYHIYEQQAKGKYSVIFKARRKKRLQFVAIKRMDKSRKQKILNQAKILQDLHHPNIIKFYDHMQTKNHMWAVTQYCPGGDLLKLIEQDKSLPQNIVKGFGIQIIRALSYAHSKGIVICDLKPASILINQYGNIKIGDFGSAQLIMDLIHNQTQKKKGTPCYMAPQLFEIGSVYSFASDFWALGCILFQLAQGTPPFVSSSLLDIAHLAKHGQTPKVQNFSPQYNNLLLRLFAKQAQNRITWKQLYNHPWIRGQIQTYQIPKQPHFQQYKKNKNKDKRSQLLRASQQFEGYGQHQPVLPNNRRQQFVFEADEQHYQDNQFQQPQSSQVQQKESIQKNIEIKQAKNQGRKQKVNDQLQDSTTINIFMQTLSSKNLSPLDQIIHHQSDNSVKPIIGNKDIQMIQSFSFNKKNLGFQYIEPQQLADGILQGNKQVQLKKILDGMVGQQKFNVLGYFESIVQNSQVANYLFKSAFISYYMKLLKGYKQSALRAKMCQILGLLIRHATSIDPQILKFGIINGFLQAIRDKSEKVRRKAMAALGELLFYGATQVDEKINEWDISMNLIHSLLKILKNVNQDEIVRLYCCKSIQNITAQAKQVGLKFSQVDTLIVLINCFNTTKNQGFRSSISCCFHHIIQLNSTLRQVFFDKIGINNIIQTFQNSQTSTKTQQILLWIILLQFQKFPKKKLTQSIMDDQNLFFSVLGLLEVNSSIVRGRVYLYIYFLISNNFKKVTKLCESKFFYLVQRQGKQGNKYQTQCLQYVLVCLYQNFNVLLQLFQEDVSKSIRVSGQPRKHFAISIISQMTNSVLFDQLFQKYSTLQAIVNLINNVDIQSQSINFQTIKSLYIQLLQKLLSNSSITQKLQEAITNNLIPIFIGKILKSKQNDIRFSCVKYLLYLVTLYLSQQKVYDSTILSSTSSKVVTLISNHLLPQCDYLLQSSQQHTLCSMILRMTATLFQLTPIFIDKFMQVCNPNSILQYYNQNSSVHVLKATQLLVSARVLSQQQLKHILSTTFKILKHYINSGQDIYLEHPLQILKHLVNLMDQAYIDQLWEIVLTLQSHEDSVIRQKSQLLVQECIKQKKISNKGKWDIKQKKGLQNYQKYLKIAGKQVDNTIIQKIKKSQGRYK